MFSRLSRREKILLLFAFIALVAGGYYYLFYQPIMEEQEIMQAEVNRLRDRHSQAVERVRQIPELEDELAALEEERQEILEAAVREPEEILAAINVFARETGVSIESYNKGERDDGHPIEMSFEGQYLSFLDFSRMIDEWDFRLVVENFDLTADENELSTTMNFFFHQPDEYREFIEEAGE